MLLPSLGRRLTSPSQSIWTSEIVAAHVSHNDVEDESLLSLITSVYGALASLGSAIASTEAPPEPDISIRSSVKPVYIVCLEDGVKLKTLRRNLMTRNNMTPDRYRQRWSLPAHYPMVAPDYTEMRRDLAKKIDLGRNQVVQRAKGQGENMR